MSFFKKLFGGGTSEPEAPKAGAPEVYKGFTITPVPFKNEGQFQTAGTIEKEVDGAVKSHKFIRADRFAGHEDACTFSLTKGRQIVDEQGERVFK